MKIEEPATTKPRSKLSIAVAKAAAELEASKKKEKQSEAAAADASSAISASVSSEVADQPASDVTPSSSNNHLDIEAAAVPTNITDSNADDKPSAHVKEVEFDAEIIAEADVPWWKRRVAKILLILVSLLAIGLGVGLGVAFSRQPPTSTAPTSTATEEEGAPGASSDGSSTLLGYCNKSPPSTGDSKDIIVSYKYTMITDGSANAAISVASRMEEQIHDAVMIEKCTINTPERKLQIIPEEVSNDVSYIGFKSSPADIISSDSCPDSTIVPEGKVCSVVEGGITAVVPTDTNDAKVRQSMSNLLQQVLSNNTIANDVGATDIAYVPSDTVTQGSVTSCSYESFATRDELKAAVDEYVSSGCNEGANVCPNITSKYGWPMNSWCVGKVTDMSELFNGYEDSWMRTFNEDVSSWDVSQVQDMNHMFYRAYSFNQDISSWDVGRVKYMYGMFQYASSFNKDLSSWDVSQVQDINRMFYAASSFNGDLSSWDVSQVQDMSSMFYYATSFNEDLSSWNVSQVQDMSWMFDSASSFNGDLSSWDVSQVQDMGAMFYLASSFNGDVTSWDVSQVQDMVAMFNGASSFNRDVSLWNISQVGNMDGMFYYASSFNQNLCAWSDKNFPYNNAWDIFTNSGCTYESTPQIDQGGPFCASDCN